MDFHIKIYIGVSKIFNSSNISGINFIKKHKSFLKKILILI